MFFTSNGNNGKQPVLHTERLVLRRFKMSDARDVYEYAKSPAVGVNAGWKQHANICESRRVIRGAFLSTNTVWAIVLKDSDKLIGSVGLLPDPKRQNPNVYMLGYSIGEDYWGFGYTTEASRVVVDYGFNVLNLNMVTAFCYPDNYRSKRVLEKLGFVYEAHLVNAELNFNQDVLDHDCYYLFKDIFEKMR